MATDRSHVQRSLPALVVAAWASGTTARADRYEATLVVRPTGIFGRVAEPVGDRPASAGPRAAERQALVDAVPGRGLDVGLSFGLRNWLDVGGELGAADFTRATYDHANVTIAGEPVTGHVERATRAVQLRVGMTLRLGVTWVPVIYLGVGAGARRRSDATILVHDNLGQPVDITPDNLTAGWSIDLVTAMRVGIEHRLNRRWTVGVDASACRAIGLGATSLDELSGSISLAYTWYSLWPE